MCHFHLITAWHSLHTLRERCISICVYDEKRMNEIKFDVTSEWIAQYTSSWVIEIRNSVREYRKVRISLRCNRKREEKTAFCSILGRCISRSHYYLICIFFFERSRFMGTWWRDNIRIENYTLFNCFCFFFLFMRGRTATVESKCAINFSVYMHQNDWRKWEAQRMAMNESRILPTIYPSPSTFSLQFIVRNFN